MAIYVIGLTLLAMVSSLLCEAFNGRDRVVGVAVASTILAVIFNWVVIFFFVHRSSKTNVIYISSRRRGGHKKVPRLPLY